MEKKVPNYTKFYTVLYPVLIHAKDNALQLKICLFLAVSSSYEALHYSPQFQLSRPIILQKFYKECMTPSLPQFVIMAVETVSARAVNGPLTLLFGDPFLYSVYIIRPVNLTSLNVL
jgi:hypothetical protein